MNSAKLEKEERLKSTVDRMRALGALFTMLGDSADAAYGEASLAVPEARIRRRLELDVLTPGGVVSLLPVESLYKMWADPRSCDLGQKSAIGAARHLYLGDSAHHVRALLQALDIDVPGEFAAMPDHIALLCELASIYCEAGNHPALESLLADHFDWIEAYSEELAERKAELECAASTDSSDGSDGSCVRIRECVEAIDHALYLLAEINKMVAELQKDLSTMRVAA